MKISRVIKILFALIAGISAGILIFSFFIGRPAVAVVDIKYAELSGETPNQIVEVLQRLKSDKRVKAVVVKLNSPGGGVTESTDLFINMVKLRQEKPVVVAITDMAASGGYYMLLGANYVYANPASFVGNIGVILWLPSQGGPSEYIITSGPFKASGGSQRMYINLVEMMKESFVRTVISQRGHALHISKEEIAEGRIYTGIEAVKLGLVDELGLEDDAISKAASLAKIKNYRVIDVNQEMESLGIELFFAERKNPSVLSFAPQFPYVYYRFIEPK